MSSLSLTVKSMPKERKNSELSFARNVMPKERKNSERDIRAGTENPQVVRVQEQARRKKRLRFSGTSNPLFLWCCYDPAPSLPLFRPCPAHLYWYAARLY